jgi:hypothetical protein
VTTILCSTYSRQLCQQNRPGGRKAYLEYFSEQVPTAAFSKGQSGLATVQNGTKISENDHKIAQK